MYFSVGGNVNWLSQYGEQYGDFSKKTSGYIPKRNEYRILKSYLCSHEITGLLTITKIWKQTKCSSTDAEIKKISHTHTHTHTVAY